MALEQGAPKAKTKDAAVQHLKTAIALEPNNQSLISEISSAYEMLGMLEEAASVYGSTAVEKKDR